MPKKPFDLSQIRDHSNRKSNNIEEETNETLAAIREGRIDAIIVERADGHEVITLNNAELPYRMMVESMNEGAVTLITDGTIAYSNPYFSKMVQMDSERLIGIRFQDLVQQSEQEAFEELFNQPEHHAGRGEFCLQRTDGTCIPVQLSIYELHGKHGGGISILATDISERIQSEEKIRSLASQLTVAEQEERQRISQVLHDDLQQRLFAIKTQLGFLSNADDQTNNVAFLDELKQIQSALTEAIGVTRNLSIDLSPPLLQSEDIHEALLWLVSQMKSQYGLQVSLNVRAGLMGLEQPMRLLLFQILRELLFNVVKHAGTTEASILVEEVGNEAQVTIEDKGQGFDAKMVLDDPTAAHGLLVIHDRLSLNRSRMTIFSAPNQGTRVVIALPLSETEV